MTRPTVCWLSEAYVRTLRRAVREIEEDTGLDALRMGAKRTKARRETMALEEDDEKAIHGNFCPSWGCLFRSQPNGAALHGGNNEACYRRHWCIQVSLNSTLFS